MKRKRRRGRKHRALVSAPRPTQESTTLRTWEIPRPPAQAIEPSRPTRISEMSERHRLALVDVKRSLVIGGAMFVLLIVLYLLLG